MSGTKSLRTNRLFNPGSEKAEADVIVLGAGILGVATAYWLARGGLSVTVIDRQAEVGLETSLANGGQVSVSHAEPWANPGAPLKVMKWLFNSKAPLLFRPKMDPHQWRWICEFLLECLPARSRANTKAIVQLALHSRQQLQIIRDREGIDYDQRTDGILHFYRDQKEFDAAQPVAEMMREIGCDRQVVDRDGVFQLEPALKDGGFDIVGGTYTESDESGDVHLFTQALAKVAENMGVTFRLGTTIEGLDCNGSTITGVKIRDGVHAAGFFETVKAKSVVVAMGSYSAPFLRPYGVNLPIYPAKGYSMTIPVRAGDNAPTLSLTDDQYKLVYSRLGDRLRVAGSAELVGYDTGINQVRCDAIFEQVSNLFPNGGDYDSSEIWTGLRPTTPSNLPLLGQKGFENLFLNTGHGTLGWTMGCGSGRHVAEEILKARGMDISPLAEDDGDIASPTLRVAA